MNEINNINNMNKMNDMNDMNDMNKLINQDYIMLIMNCNKYRYKAEIQKLTWLKNIQENL